MSWANVLSMADCNAAVADLYAFDPKTGHAYTMLILRLRKVGSTPFEDRSLAAIARCTRHFWVTRAWPALQELFEVRDGRLFHPEVEGLRGQGSYPREVEAPSDRRRQAAQVAANARWGGRSNLNVVSGDDAANGTAAHANASESHTGNDAISMTSAYASDAISASDASAGASVIASSAGSDRMPDASRASGAGSLSQQRDSLSEGSKIQTDSLGERAPARAGQPAGAMRSDAITDAMAHANASESHAEMGGTPNRTSGKKIPIPPLWKPSAECESEARQYGYEAADLAPGFRDYYLGNGVRAADWDAMFRTWCRRQADHDGRQRQGNMALPISGGAAAPEPPEDPADTISLLNDDPDNPRIVAAWIPARARLRAELGEAAWHTCRAMVLGGLDGDEIVIMLPGEFARDLVRERFGPRIVAPLLQAYPEARRVDFRVNAPRAA